MRQLWRLWRNEKDDPEPFYTVLAREAVADLDRRYGPLAGRTVLDMGCGPGFYTRAFRDAGAKVIPLDNSQEELELHGAAPDGAILADVLRRRPSCCAPSPTSDWWCSRGPGMSGRSRRSSSATAARCCGPRGAICPRRGPRTRSSRRYIAAWSALQRGDDVRDLRAWLYRIVHNTALNQLRVSGYDYAELEESLRESEVAAGGAGASRGRAPDAYRLAALPERQREALLQIAVEGRTQEEVARELGVTEGAVRQLVHRARLTLRAAATAVSRCRGEWAAAAGGAWRRAAERRADRRADRRHRRERVRGQGGLVAVLATTTAAVAGPRSSRPAPIRPARGRAARYRPSPAGRPRGRHRCPLRARRTVRARERRRPRSAAPRAGPARAQRLPRRWRSAATAAPGRRVRRRRGRPVGRRARRRARSASAVGLVSAVRRLWFSVLDPPARVRRVLVRRVPGRRVPVVGSGSSVLVRRVRSWALVRRALVRRVGSSGSGSSGSGSSGSGSSLRSSGSGSSGSGTSGTVRPVPARPAPARRYRLLGLRFVRLRLDRHQYLGHRFVGLRLVGLGLPDVELRLRLRLDGHRFLRLRLVGPDLSAAPGSPTSVPAARRRRRLRPAGLRLVPVRLRPRRPTIASTRHRRVPAVARSGRQGGHAHPRPDDRRPRPRRAGGPGPRGCRLRQEAQGRRLGEAAPPARLLARQGRRQGRREELRRVQARHQPAQGRLRQGRPQGRRRGRLRQRPARQRLRR